MRLPGFRPPCEQQQLGVIERRRPDRVLARAARRGSPSTSSPAPRAIRASSRAVKHVVHSSKTRSSPASLRTVACSWSTPVRGSNSSPSSSQRTAKPAENALTRDAPARADGPPDAPDDPVVVSPPSSPNPPWQRQIAASYSPSHASRGRRAPRRSPAARPRLPRSRASATKSGERSTPWVVMPRRASASECRPGPQPTSSTRIPGVSPSWSTRKSISCSVPFVNAFRRYAGPRNSGDLVEPGATGYPSARHGRRLRERRHPRSADRARARPHRTLGGSVPTTPAGSRADGPRVERIG